MPVNDESAWLSSWRGLYLVPLFLFTILVALDGLVLGSMSIQWFAAYVSLFGSLVLLGMIVGAGWAVICGTTMRPWMIRYLASFVLIVIAEVISTLITDARRSPPVVATRRSE